MKSKFSLHFLPLIVAFCPILATTATAGILLGLNTPVTQNFDTPKLIRTGTATDVQMATTTPFWTFSETGTNANGIYAADAGSNGSGDTWSFGTDITDNERALGTVRSASLVSMFGAVFTRNISTPGIFDIYIKITYTGEQWRLGNTGRVDQLDFEFSTNATSLTTGTWTAFDSLDFTAPVTAGTVGGLNGDLSANQTAVSPSTNFTVSVANGADFWIRWTDFQAAGADDGLAVDNFSITALPEPSTTTLFGALGVAMLLRRRR